jgi:ABC-2 type transport system ATP-binding protein
MIECEGLTHSYGAAEPALAGLNLRIGTGECFGLIGANGAGKTTTIRILSTLLVPTSGHARIAGHDVVTDYLAVRRAIGYMPESPAIFPEFRAGEFLDYTASMYGLDRSERERRVQAVLAITDLAGKRDAMCTSLSLGMRQRLFLARALVHDPKVLILDEPSSGLDPAARVEFRHIMRDLTASGATIIVSSHILPELSSFCTSVGILERGKLVVSGSVDAVLATVKGATEITIEVTGDASPVATALRGKPGVGAVRIDGPQAVVQFTGTRDQQAQLVRALVDAGVPVVSFAEKRATLEEIFMKVAAFETA